MIEDKSQTRKLNFLFITANVGTLFENLEGIENVWLKEVIKIVQKHHAHFVALHCQEVGGKDYKDTPEPVIRFFKKLSNLEELSDFTIVQGILDGDCDEVDQFTALGNVYLVHKSVTRLEIFNFKKEIFESISGKALHTNGVNDKLPFVRKEKFEQDYFPECKWSRKGYCRMRWKICGKVIELVNVHLFHDDSNLKAVKSSPSIYTVYRKRALNYVLNKLKKEYPSHDDASTFLFGDLNFRLDLKALVKSVCPSSKKQVVRSRDEDDDVIRLLYRSSEKNGESSTSPLDTDDVVVKIEKKFLQIKHSSFQPNTLFDKLQSFDREFSLMDVDLNEFCISFAPTYPYSENLEQPEDYMMTRAPSWCDRILLSDSAWNWIRSQENSGNAVYDVIGGSVCMGDHKPVYLAFTTTVEDVSNGGATNKAEAVIKNGPKEQKSDGPKEQKSDGPKEQKSDGPKEQKSDGPKEQNSDSPKAQKSDGLKEQNSDSPKAQKSDATPNETDAP